jgi:type IV secretory pathway VirB3-like protein
MAGKSSESLKEVRIFAKEDTIWGIPSKLFIGSGVMTVAMLTQIPIVFALAIGALLFGVLFAIYNDDPRALQAWQRSMGRPVRWTANPRRNRRVTMLASKD